MRKSNSSGDHKIEVLKNVIFLSTGIPDGTKGEVLVSDFKGHSKEIVKSLKSILKSGTCARPDNYR